MSARETAKEAILARVASAVEDAPAAELPLEPAYLTHGGREPDILLHEFVERVRDYGVASRTVRAAELPAAIAAVLAARGARRLVVPRDLPPAWLAQGFEWVADDELSFAALDTSDGVLSGCALAIAQTGTVVLDGGPRQGRRALTLLPDYHLCVVETSRLVDLVPEAVARLAPPPGVRRPLTFISGPSATSDIELSRVEGVHGPRTLEILLVTD
jgi:L-lactate dehydrogenase complex protein LldG